jgi:glutamate dehydrogenase
LAATDVHGSKGDRTVLDAVIARIEDDARPFPDLITRFARSYLRRVPPAPALSADELHDEVVGLYEFIEVRSEPIAVRAFNPPADDDVGPPTVIEVTIDDGPFLVDSIGNELQAHGLGVSRVLHPVIGVQRDEEGRLTHVRPARASDKRESVQHWVLERRLFDADLPALEQALRRVLVDVQATVRDFGAMVGVIPRMIELVRRGEGHYPVGDVDESVAFLEWLLEDNFVFLGYREYELMDTDEGGALQAVHASGLGILTESAMSKRAEPTLLASLPPQLATRYESGDLLVVSKSNRLSTVHRRARMDYVGVRIVGSGGETVGEARLLGLFTSKAYMERASRTPLLRKKLDELASAEDLIEGSHDHKAIVSLFDSFPKDDLFGLPFDDLRPLLMGLLTRGERAKVRFFVRRDLLDRTARLLLAMPADRYSSTLVKRLEELFLERFNGESVDFNLSLEADEMAHLHFKVWVDEGQVPDVAFDELQSQVREITRSWAERVGDVLSRRHGAAKARNMVQSWAECFPDYYTTSTELDVAAGDIEKLAELARGDHSFVVGLQNESKGSEILTRVALYGSRKRHLSELIPALEDMGLRVVEEVPTRLSGEDELFVHDFGVLGPDDRPIDLERSAARMSDALSAVWKGEVETDSLHRLLLVSDLDHSQIAILRAYRTYWQRVRPAFTVNYVNETLTSHPAITRRLIDLFEMRFQPEAEETGYEAARYRLLGMLDDVPSLDEDRILRTFLHLIEATVRTNAYKPGRNALSLKLRSSQVPDMPAPRPFAEVFVLGCDVEGIHLRAGPVARGGIRWSDRREDYRTEVLGLLKAQITKNSMIVPTGAKGGFVLRRPPSDQTAMHEAVVSAYSTFIRGLLDLTDNLSGGNVVHPEGIRVHDDDDPYLVVAADKGTSTFSDIANQIARDYGYWLDDAFASGGSTGYDHKALGITARGAWVSLERHLLELGTDPHLMPFTAVGIGDMSGDVFGNGMLGSDKIKLVAAFDHRHVFIDPDPDPAASFAERRRLFDLPRSIWTDYDGALISKGGGVFSRAAKKISLSTQAQKALRTEAETVTPAELIRIILCAPVDVLWNGGIGTYVKATDEPNGAVGDKTNDPVRVNASQLRCRVVVEGGNLGLTQRGRIEYALSGGKVNSDFIDNSAGVNCSDREVNLKILSSLARSQGLVERDESHRLLERVVEDVIERILHDSFEQAQRLALEESTSVHRMDSYEQLMDALEEDGLLDRELEGLPSTEEMFERSRAGKGLTRPEIGVILAYAKRSLADSLLLSDSSEIEVLTEDVLDYFPDEVATRFAALIPKHPLLRQLVATIVASKVIDTQGSTFVSQLVARTGAAIPRIVTAHRIAQVVSDGTARRDEIEHQFGSVDVEMWTQAINASDRLVASLTRSYLREASETVDWGRVEGLAAEFKLLEEAGATLGPPRWEADRHKHAEDLAEAGFPVAMAHRLAMLRDLAHAPGILEVADRSGRPVVEVGRVFFRIGQAVQLDNLASLLAKTAASDPWKRWARQTIEDDLIRVQRRLAECALSEAEDNESGDDAVDSFLASRSGALKRVLRLTHSLESDQDLAFFMVVLGQIEALAGVNP